MRKEADNIWVWILSFFPLPFLTTVQSLSQTELLQRAASAAAAVPYPHVLPNVIGSSSCPTTASEYQQEEQKIHAQSNSSIMKPAPEEQDSASKFLALLSEKFSSFSLVVSDRELQQQPASIMQGVKSNSIASMSSMQSCSMGEFLFDWFGDGNDEDHDSFVADDHQVPSMVPIEPPFSLRSWRKRKWMNPNIFVQFCNCLDECCCCQNVIKVH